MVAGKHPACQNQDLDEVYMRVEWKGVCSCKPDVRCQFFLNAYEKENHLIGQSGGFFNNLRGYIVPVFRFYGWVLGNNFTLDFGLWKKYCGGPYRGDPSRWL